MILRPTSFFIPSSTELKIFFSLELSLALTKDNFYIESISGSGSDLEIVSVEIKSNSAVLKTRPQVPGNYYLLRLQDTDYQPFTASDGSQLINDSVSRDIFFLGIDNVNKIRDDMLSKVPQIYNIDGTKIYNVISGVAEEILDAQHDIGSVLNSNYLKLSSFEEIRTRGSGAYDRLANENAYDVTSVSKFRAADNNFANQLVINSASTSPINLRQTLVESEEISSSTKQNSFVGFLLNLSKSNILKVLSIKVVRDDDLEDCNGNIGTYYDIEKYKYSILNNRYDQDNAFSFYQLSSNQVLISDFGNIARLEPTDTVIVSYYYDDVSKNIDLDTLQVYSKESVINESVPSNSTNFFLKNAPIINDSGVVATIDAVAFKTSENSNNVPAEFSIELEFSFSRLPRSLGEYSVNYETGEVVLVGSSKAGEGTGFNYHYCDYIYKNIFSKDVDYFVDGGEIDFKSNRPIIGKTVYIDYNYTSVFRPGIDYATKTHSESLGELVQNKYTSSFSIKTENSPITDVFRVSNQTTGEVYSVLYFNDNEIFISGRVLPRVLSKLDEPSNFKTEFNEPLVANAEVVSPMYKGVVISNPSTNAITISPPIPAEFLDPSSSYIMRIDENIDGVISVTDKYISYFHSADGNNNIATLAISPTDVVPSVGQKIIIGVKTFVFNLKNNLILNKSKDGIGSFVSSSIEFNNEDFKSEKYFKKINKNNAILPTSAGSIFYTVSTDSTNILYGNLSKIRASGDYSVDYQNGVIYLGVNPTQSYFVGEASYTHGEHSAQNYNIISADFISKRNKISEDKNQSQVIYDSLYSKQDSIKILDLEATYQFYSGELIADPNGEFQESFIVRPDYTAYTTYDISSISAVNTLQDLFGNNLSSIYSYNREIEKTSEQLTTPILDGGFNYFDSKYVSFSKNLIDFKGSFTSRLVLSSGGIYEIQIKDEQISSFYNAIEPNSGDEIIDVNYNIYLQRDISVTSTVVGPTTIEVYFDQIDSNYFFNDGYDYIIDSSSNEFLVTEYNQFDGYFVIEKFSSNNPSNEFSSDSFSLILKPSISISSGMLTVLIPENFVFDNYSKIKISFLTTITPAVGTALAVDYHYGSIYIDYTYVYDNLSVWYEHGDNQIDWSINNSISEGETYYVSYNYGALRNSLKKNFAALTNIPKLKNFPLNMDREAYRDFLIGVLQSFPKGPTIPSISGLISSVTKTKPDITESVFGNWILGRDYLSHQTVNYDGNLVFEPAKFNDGLSINNDNIITIPAVSNLSLNEGTLEAWIRPNWNGIDNDATLTFDFENVGTSVYSYIGGGDPFDFKNGFKTSTNIEVGNYGTDPTGSQLTIFKASVDGDGYDPSFVDLNFSITHDKSEVTRINKTNFVINIKQNYLNVGELSPYLSLNSQKMLSGGFVAIDDDFRTMLLELGYLSYSSSPTIYVSSSVFGDTLLDFAPPYQTRGCKCEVADQNSVLQNFNNLTFHISFDENISSSDIIYSDAVITSSPKSFCLVDQDGYLYDVVSMFDSFGIEHKSDIPTIISKIVVKRYPENYQSLSSKQAADINSIQITSFMILNKVIKLKPGLDDSSGSNKSNIFFGSPNNALLNWSEFSRISISRDPIQNLSTISISGNSFQYFYTDFYSSDSVIPERLQNLDKNKISIGVLSISSISVKGFRLEVENKFGLSDIYIGSSGYHPARSLFRVNRMDGSNSVGISSKVENTEGIFIGFDPNCASPVDSSIGQWVIKVRNNKFSSLPYDVNVDGAEYENLYSSEMVPSPLIGKIETDGEFSSAARGRRLVGGSCGNDSLDCSGFLRYCGEQPLEDGWIKYSDTSSDLINVFGGRQQEIIPWLKIGDFSTSLSNSSYRMESLQQSFEDQTASFGYGLLTPHECNLGDTSISNSIKINFVDSSLISLGLNAIESSFFYTGICPIIYSTSEYEISVAYAFNQFGQEIISLIDQVSGQEVATVVFNWNDFNYHSVNLEVLNKDDIVRVFFDNSLILISSLSSFSKKEIINCQTTPSNYIATSILNAKLVNASEFITSVASTSLDTNLIMMSYSYVDGEMKLEDGDLFIQENDSKISFSLIGNSDDDLFEVDGYITLSDLDEIFITSDRPKYLVDSGISESNSRFSIFKDGKGFLNFRIYDRKIGDENTLFNISTDVRSFKIGELHHIAASWKLNSHNESDEMHLFVDGLEAANIYKFGGKIPLKLNAKFSDVSQEVLQDHIYKNIVYYDVISSAAILAGDTKLYSEYFTGSEDIVSRGIIIKSSVLADSIVGNYYTIIAVGDGFIQLGDPETFNPVVFQVSASDISFQFPPSCGEIYGVKTDIYNDRFSIIKSDCEGNRLEMGGVEVGIIDGKPFISTNNVYEQSFRYNSKLRIIEFIKYDDYTCSWIESAEKTDLSISIVTYGLKTRLLNQIIQLSGSSLYTSASNDLSFYLNVDESISLVQTSGPKPRDILDVEIKKILIKDYIVDESTITIEDGLVSDFQFIVNKETSLLTSEYISKSKINDGRYLSLIIDTDNIEFCGTDGYSEEINYVDIYGNNSSGSPFERVFFNKNGAFKTSERFYSLDSISGKIKPIDTDYEVCKISVEESDNIDVQNGLGDFAKIERFVDGKIIIATAGSEIYDPFELPPGYYRLQYPSTLFVDIPIVGNKLYIGSSIFGKNQLNAIIDDFVIKSEMLLDLRPYQLSADGMKTITHDFNKPRNHCLSSNVLSLITFNNPVDYQSRMLRTYKFLDQENNISYTLDLDEREKLIKLINNKEEFISTMINMGYSIEDATKVFVVCHGANGGPIKNIAESYPIFSDVSTSSSSVNSSFGNSAKFNNNKYSFFNNNSILRNDSGQIEFWVSPMIDTKYDFKTRYYFDAYSAVRISTKTTASNLIKLSNPASKILSVKLLKNNQEFSQYLVDKNLQEILFDEISRSEITGMLQGGTGVEKDFSGGATLSPDGRTILLSETMPGANTDVVVTYVPKEFSGQRISILKDRFSRIIFRIINGNDEYFAIKAIDWDAGEWHRICCSYAANTKSDFMRMIVDGIGEENIYFRNSGINQSDDYDIDSSTLISKLKLKLDDQFSQVTIGNDLFDDYSAKSRIDNFRISKQARSVVRDSSGTIIDPAYSSNISTIFPVKNDDLTTAIFDFDLASEQIDSFATIIDDVNGIFSFDIDIYDVFNKVAGIGDGSLEDLLVELINRIKPAHSNAVIKFDERYCKE